MLRKNLRSEVFETSIEISSKHVIFVYLQLLKKQENILVIYLQKFVKIKCQ